MPIKRINVVGVVEMAGEPNSEKHTTPFNRLDNTDY
jgi:hypothetical protein